MEVAPSGHARQLEERAMDLYSKLYILTTDSHAELLECLAAATGGSIDGWTVVAQGYEIDVRPNRVAPELVGTDNVFLAFPFTAEIVANGRPLGLDEFLAHVARLMKYLHERQMGVVAACDWEERLPGGGGLWAPPDLHPRRGAQGEK